MSGGEQQVSGQVQEREVTVEEREAATVVYQAIRNQLSFAAGMPLGTKQRDDAYESANLLLDDFIEDGHDKTFARINSQEEQAA